MDDEVFEKARRAVLEMKESIPKAIKETINREVEVLRRLQTESQLFKGKNSEGDRIVPLYKPLTIKIKKEKGDPWDRVTLADTGEFYDTLIIEGYDDYYKIEFSPTLEYGRKLIEKYGSNVLGIQQELIEDFVRTFVADNLKKNWNDILAR